MFGAKFAVFTLFFAVAVKGDTDEAIDCVNNFVGLPPSISQKERCFALDAFAECVKLAATDMIGSESRKYSKIVETAQAAGLYKCQPGDLVGVTQPKITTVDENMRVTVGASKDVRFRRINGVQDVSVFDIMQDVTQLKNSTVKTSELQGAFDTMWGQKTDPLDNMVAALSKVTNDAGDAMRDAVMESEERVNTSLHEVQGYVMSNMSDMQAAMNTLRSNVDRDMTGNISAMQLDVKEAMRVAATTQPQNQTVVKDTGCTSAYLGLMRYDTTTKMLQFCDGSKFIPLNNDIEQTTADYTKLGSYFNPASSCKALKSANYPSGTYYLKLGSTVKKHYCDNHWYSGGWTLLMKTAPGATFDYDSKYWQDSNVLNEDKATSSMDGDAMFEAYNQLKISELMLVTIYGKVVLKIPSGNKALKDQMGYTKTQLLQQTAGDVNRPEMLFRANREVELHGFSSTCGHAWRLEGNSRSNNFRLRIGGHFTRVWSCGYGTDHKGQACAAEGAGFGVRDSTWGPYKYARKSSGIRHAHDYYSSCQKAVHGQIYGR